MPNKSLLIHEIGKIKLFKEPAINNSRKIKVTHNSVEDYYFSLEAKAKFGILPLQYYWFAKLITMKLIEKGCNLKNSYVP